MDTAVVVFESMFGNTALVARAIADGLGAEYKVEVSEVNHAHRSLPQGTALLVVGGPTHAFGMSRASTRAEARTYTDHDVISRYGGMREWLDLVTLPRDFPVATFDTRVRKGQLPGSAAHAAARHLRRHQHADVVGHESFWVSGMTESLVDGELERARDWGQALARKVVPAA